MIVHSHLMKSTDDHYVTQLALIDYLTKIKNSLVIKILVFYVWIWFMIIFNSRH